MAGGALGMRPERAAALFGMEAGNMDSTDNGIYLMQHPFVMPQTYLKEESRQEMQRTTIPVSSFSSRQSRYAYIELPPPATKFPNSTFCVNKLPRLFPDRTKYAKTVDYIP